ncbi:MAG: transporter substrate-binding domain-containing protein [Pseudomonadota bacterium]
MKNSSTLRRLWALAILMLAWRAGPASAIEPFRITTAVLPPFAIEADRKNPGALVEVVEELTRRAKVLAPIEFVPWKRAILLSQHDARTAIFPLTRNRARETAYRWLVKLYSDSTVFTARSGGLDLRDPAALKNLRVAVVRESSNQDQLRDDGFSQIVDVADVRAAMKLLHEGLVDLAYGTETVYRDAPKSLGYAESAFKYSVGVHSFDLWLGGSRDFGEADAAELQSAMKAMVKDGTYVRILQKYTMRLPAAAR